MTKSMTGFGMGEYKDEQYNISVECKTINHKYLDINPRMPRKISFLEDKLRVLVKEYLNRGRVDMFIKFETLKSSGEELNYNEELATQYVSILNKIKADFNLEDNIKLIDVAKFPDVVTVSETEDDEDLLWTMLSKAVTKCLEKLTEMRTVEGEKLAQDVLERADILEKNILEIEKYSDSIVDEYKEKLNARIKDIVKDPSIIDENRLSQEVAIYADKSNITEEIVRFKSHVQQLRDTVVKNESIGRKMDFIIQEMNRETNTLGSKSSNINITNIVIEIKSELEKIREQIQNIE